MRTGPHSQGISDAARAAAVNSPIGKQIDGVELFASLHPAAFRVFRHWWAPSDQSLSRSAQEIVDAILAGLGGYRHPRLYVEVYNELGKGSTADYIKLLKQVVPLLHKAGLKVCGPSWATGDYDLEQWKAFRDAQWCGMDAISLHCYWADLGPTEWNAYRWEQWWAVSAGDPELLFITECGRDKKVRDGDPAVNEGYLGKGGWIADGIPKSQFESELVSFDTRLRRRKGVYAVAFTYAPNKDWVNYSMETVKLPPGCDFYQPSPTTGGNMPDYSKAIMKLSPNHSSRGDHKPVAEVVHIGQGYKAGFESLFMDPAKKLSAHYTINYDGSVIQWVPESEAAWTCGIDYTDGYLAYKSNTTIPWIHDLWEDSVNPNLVTINVELEGFYQTPCTVAQWASLKALTKDIFTRNNWPTNDPARLIGHCSLDMVNRPNDPGKSVDLVQLYSYLIPAPQIAPLDDALNGIWEYSDRILTGLPVSHPQHQNAVELQERVRWLKKALGKE